MKTKQFVTYSIIMLLFVGEQSLQAQDGRTCDFDAYNSELNSDEIINTRKKDILKSLVSTDRSNVNDCDSPIRIPVAFHFSGSISQSGMDCLIEACEAQIEVLNNDFNYRNSDINKYHQISASCPYSYPSLNLEDGSCLEFCMATYSHPSGSGIAEGQYAITVGRYSWPSAGNAWSGYLNIFVQDGLSYLGVAPLFGGLNPNGNGVQVLASAFGGPGVSCTAGTGINTSNNYALGRTLTHEVGHYLGLRHIFQGCPDGDQIDDTPAQTFPNFGCPSVNTSNCNTTAINSCGEADMYMNYMDYVNDACMYMFSDDQCTLMHAVADHDDWKEEALCGIAEGVCYITDVGVTHKQCIQAGTPQYGQDDRFTFRINPTGLGIGSTYSVFGDYTRENVPYGQAIILDNSGIGYAINAGGIYLVISDDQNPDCKKTIIVSPPAPCAEPIADFFPRSDVFVCEQNPIVEFRSESTNNPSWIKWQVSGPEAELQYETIPQTLITFYQPGKYRVQLIAQNTYGVDTTFTEIEVGYKPQDADECGECTYKLVAWDSKANGWTSSQSLVTKLNGNNSVIYGPESGESYSINEIGVAGLTQIKVTANTGSTDADQMAWRLFDQNGRVVLGDGDAFGFGPVNNQGTLGAEITAPQNGKSFTINEQCETMPLCAELELEITFDRYPEETAWKLTDHEDNIVYQSMGYQDMDNQSVQHQFCLEAGCYKFSLMDFYGDGMCCSYGAGNVKLSNPSTEFIYLDGGQFTGEMSVEFCLDEDDLPESEEEQEPEEPLDPCPEVIVFSNEISNGQFQAQRMIITNTKLTESDSLILKAGQSIELLSGLSIDVGAQLEISIDTCSNVNPIIVPEDN